MRPAPDTRFWILDPAGHRRVENGLKDQHKDGDIIDHPIFGEAVLIIPPAPPAEEWYCDICSEPMLTKFGRQPWPVPMIGSYALCLDHFNQFKDAPWDDEDTGDVIEGTRMGEWPYRGCRCGACLQAASIVLSV